MAQANDFTTYRGEDVVLTFTMTPTTNISGWTIDFNARRSLTDPTIFLTVAGVVTNAAAGIFTVTLSAANTLTVSGSVPYDVVRTDSGSVAVLSIGTWTNKGGVRTL